MGFCGGRWLGFYVTPTVGLPKVRSSSWQSSIIPPPSPRALLLLLLTALQHLWQPFWRPPLPAALSHDPSVPDSCPARGEMGNTRGEMGKKRSGGTLSPATAGQFFKFLVAVTAKAPTTFCSRKKSRTKHWAGGRKLCGAHSTSSLMPSATKPTTPRALLVKPSTNDWAEKKPEAFLLLTLPCPVVRRGRVKYTQRLRVAQRPQEN